MTIQALTKGRVFPNRLNDWRVVSLIFLGLVVTLPDLGNATIISLIIIIMLSVSGIGYRWFSTALMGITVGATVLLGSIWVIGADVVAKIPVFGYIAKRFAAFFNPFEKMRRMQVCSSLTPTLMSNGGWLGRGLGNSDEKERLLA